MSTLDMDSLNDMMLTLYDELSRLTDPEEKETVRQIAFGYYHLVRRYQDVNPDFDTKGTCMFFYHSDLFYSVYEISLLEIHEDIDNWYHSSTNAVTSNAYLLQS